MSFVGKPERRVRRLSDHPLLCMLVPIDKWARGDLVSDRGQQAALIPRWGISREKGIVDSWASGSGFLLGYGALA